MKNGIERRFIAIAAILIAGLAGWALWPVDVSATVSSTGTSVPRFTQTYNRTTINDSTGTVTIIPGVANKRTQIWGCTLATASATTMEFKSGSTTLTGPMNVSAIQIDPPPGNVIPWIESINAGDDIVLILGGAVQVTGQIIWTQTP